MGHLSNRNIVIGVSGGIAAYKAAELVRLLRREGAIVRVIMSRGALAFITPLSMQALSGNPVHTELLDEDAEMGMGHIELARWADMLMLAPATADVIARLAQGRADDLLTTVALATTAPLYVAPAMNQNMWLNPATATNIATLTERGITVVGPNAGDQACGDNGPGRLLEPVEMLAAITNRLPARPLGGKRVVITAGPTREALDPVRYLSNHSSGKMGFALAGAAAEAGAEVVLITGPVALESPDHISRVDVESAQEMLAAVMDAVSSGTDIFIAAAAVADYRPISVEAQKIKKTESELSLALVRNPDILKTVANATNRPPLVIGFAAETHQVAQHANQKLVTKSLDAIVANDVSRSDIGFNSDHNAVALFTASGSEITLEGSKRVVAESLIAAFTEMLENKATNIMGTTNG
jgi:phosphopantothenoylcysteine decarboxylase/phosphopantothenate--cysteine ligase